MDNDIYSDAAQSDTTAVTNQTAETVGYTAVTAKIVNLKELPANAVVLTLNVNPWIAGLNLSLIHI